MYPGMGQVTEPLLTARRERKGAASKALPQKKTGSGAERPTAAAEHPLSEGGVHEETHHGSPNPQQRAECPLGSGTDGGGARESGISLWAEAVPTGGGEGTTPSAEGATIATRSCSKSKNT